MSEFDVVLIFSGGADSTTLLYDLIAHRQKVMALSFNYGQRHRRELDAATTICARINVPHSIMQIPDIAAMSKSALLGDFDIPHGHYEEESMKSTVVPNRNMVMLSIAASVAISQNIPAIAFAAHSGDHAIYPDCREEFRASIENTINVGNWTENRLLVIAPYINLTKTQIFRIGRRLCVPYQDTWTCYEGGQEPCGLCGSCVERAEAEKDSIE